ncbi:hypothetical protein HMPREF3056_07380 [Corynebacterium sp. HMSC056F09]|nr:hypothetical protein HMPREF2806_12400 [Corynebacterium sp. HMSC076G08]OFO22107.1 hypothetical protein HMPREF3056_07380 [Corynebacterium sp. HMSC056F09]OFO95928.1 hypothetical protein HMPREF3009_00550 [Corynebacterium sp. HMSC034H07]OFP29322.1 hypothetical protein HMPREF2993_10965 [Corynebacterium sp. HMSC068G04]
MPSAGCHLSDAFCGPRIRLARETKQDQGKTKAQADARGQENQAEPKATKARGQRKRRES